MMHASNSGSPTLTIDIVYPFPHRESDGVADHTLKLAATLQSRGHRVRLLAARGATKLRGFEVVEVWEGDEVQGVGDIVETVTAGNSDCVLVQFEQFTYGRRGYNPEFSRLFRKIGARTRLTVPILIAHETYVTPRSVRTAVMWLYQRAQFRSLARAASVVLVTCEEWGRRARREGASTTLAPVPSAIPVTDLSREECRARLGVDEDLVVAFFGFMDTQRAAMAGLALDCAQLGSTTFVYAGKDSARAESISNGKVKQIILENADARIVSEVLTAADLGVAPFADGATLRRSSLAAMLAHGLPTVSTETKQTDALLRTLRDRGALRLTKPLAEEFALAVCRLASAEPQRLAMRAQLAQSTEMLPSWERLADLVEEAVAMRRHQSRGTEPA